MSTPRVRTISVLSAAAAFLHALLPACCIALLALPACTKATEGTPVFDETDAAVVKSPTEMRVVSSFGGAHRALVVTGNLWFQSFANRILILESETGTVISDVEVAPRGGTGPVVDLAVRHGSLFVVLDRDSVIEIDVRDPRAPRFLARWTLTELGLEPTGLSVVDGEVLVSGLSGVVPLTKALPAGMNVDSEGRIHAPVLPKKWLDGKAVGKVVAAPGGPVACVGRRILRLETGEFLGAASILVPLESRYGGGFGFVLQATDGAQVGIMETTFRERSTGAVRGTVRSLRALQDTLVAVTDSEMAVWTLGASAGDGAITEAGLVQLGEPTFVAVQGARDVGWVKPNRYAVAGTFGRALYRLRPEGDRAGDTFYWSERAPGRIDVSVSDGRRILAAGVEGAWMYLIGDKAELVERPIASPDPQNARADVVWGSATCDEAREQVAVNLANRVVMYRPSRRGLISTLTSADGKIWVGHDDGIDVLGFDRTNQEIVCEARIQLAGPVVAIYPNRVGGGVSYVARLDGFGVVRPVPFDAPPRITPGTVECFGPKPEALQGARKQ